MKCKKTVQQFICHYPALTGRNATVFLETNSLLRSFAEDNTHRTSALYLLVCSDEILSCALCFDYGVYSEMIINLRTIKAMHLILFNNMSLTK